MTAHCPLLLIPTLILVLVTALHAAPPRDDESNLVRHPEGKAATVSVDSIFSGYRKDVLNDGLWIAPGEETTWDTGSADRLGNAGNTWVSAATEIEHWVRLDWPEAVSIGRVEIWWTQDTWYPRAFRVEYLSDRSWVPVLAPETWLEPTARRTMISFEPVQAQSFRVVQPARGARDQGLMALQEVMAFADGAGAETIQGARVLSPSEQRKLGGRELVPNLARLSETQPGASRCVVWRSGEGEAGERPALVDGDTSTPAGQVWFASVEWPVQHVADRVVLHFAAEAARVDDLAVLARNGENWQALEPLAEQDGGRLELSFEPFACEAIGVRFRKPVANLAEVEVLRYLPASPNTWPERLVADRRFETQLLASGNEPGYDDLVPLALSMTPARALLGLKDLREEIGVARDGTILARERLSFGFGEDEITLDDCLDTVTRVLIDGWRPGTVIEGRAGDLLVRQTAFVSFADENREIPALFVRTEVTRADGRPGKTQVRLRVKGLPASATLQDGVLTCGSRPILATTGAGRLAGEGAAVEFDVDCPGTLDIVYPHGLGGAHAAPGVYRNAGYSAALARFRSYWDELIAPAATVEVPEDRVNLMLKAVLAQVCINADGNILPYGSMPSVYEGSLYGVEEGFAMMALGYFGLSGDAERYMDATYLHPEFLKKVEEYKTYSDRHQQYRNGLQPMYAVSLARLTGNLDWLSKHADLFRECAEWTFANRRKTMELENGEKPLHWGLLPKWSYGGDIAELQCYALYANLACWRGLEDTAWMFQRLSDGETATRYLEEARAYRQDIDRAIEGNYRSGHKPPFLPLRLYAGEPVGDDYYQLFAGVLLDLMPFEMDSRHLAWIVDYMEADNLIFCGLPRFRRDAGPGGLDGLYGLGYALTKLHQDKIDEFLLAFYAYLAFNLERGTFASRETNLLYASDLHAASAYPVPDMSDPIPCSSAVPVNYLRHMLVTEELAGPSLPSRTLRLLWAVPRAWLRDGQQVRFERMPTHFGPVSCQVTSRAGEGRIEAVVTPPTREPWEAIKLRLRHPDGAKMERVTVNGAEWAQFDPEQETVTLLPGPDRFEVRVEY